MTDEMWLTILLGILGFAVLGLLWLVFKLQDRVEELERNMQRWEEKK